jgi:nitroreductase
VKNEVSSLLQNHRSIRKYKDEPIPDEVLAEILNSAQWAPSSHHVQAYSIIVVKNKETKQKLSAVAAGQKYVENCPVFLVFCADFYRLKLVSEMYGTPFEVDEVENLLVGAVDTALAAENAFITAKSYGLGGVMIGGIRNNLEEVKHVLNLPSYTYPMMGMCLGYPDQDIWQKPRLPQSVVVHLEQYHSDQMIDGLQEYEKVTADYYTWRTKGQRTFGWTKYMAEYLSNPRRPNVTSFLKSQGFKIK